jgi:hypothetical protein
MPTEPGLLRADGPGRPRAVEHPVAGGRLVVRELRVREGHEPRERAPRRRRGRGRAAEVHAPLAGHRRAAGVAVEAERPVRPLSGLGHRVHHRPRVGHQHPRRHREQRPQQRRRHRRRLRRPIGLGVLAARQPQAPVGIARVHLAPPVDPCVERSIEPEVGRRVDARLRRRSARLGATAQAAKQRETTADDTLHPHNRNRRAHLPESAATPADYAPLRRGTRSLAALSAP